MSDVFADAAQAAEGLGACIRGLTDAGFVGMSYAKAVTAACDLARGLSVEIVEAVGPCTDEDCDAPAHYPREMMLALLGPLLFSLRDSKRNGAVLPEDIEALIYDANRLTTKEPT